MTCKPPVVIFLLTNLKYNNFDNKIQYLNYIQQNIAFLGNTDIINMLIDVEYNKRKNKLCLKKKDIIYQQIIQNIKTCGNTVIEHDNNYGCTNCNNEIMLVGLGKYPDINALCYFYNLVLQHRNANANYIYIVYFNYELNHDTRWTLQEKNNFIQLIDLYNINVMGIICSSNIQNTTQCIIQTQTRRIVLITTNAIDHFTEIIIADRRLNYLPQIKNRVQINNHDIITNKVH